MDSNYQWVRNYSNYLRKVLSTLRFFMSGEIGVSGPEVNEGHLEAEI